MCSWHKRTAIFPNSIEGIGLCTLVEALKGMERVAEHINEMQRIHEEYGAIFDHLYRQQLKSSKQVSRIFIPYFTL